MQPCEAVQWKIAVHEIDVVGTLMHDPARRRELRVPVFVHEDDLAASRHVPRPPPSGLFMNRRRPVVFRHVLLDVVRDGDVLDAPERPRAIHVPGHTAGECMLHPQGRSVVLNGDALVTPDLLTGEQVGPRAPYPPRERRRRKSPSFDGRAWQGTIGEAIDATGIAGRQN